jgi:hypothetical protein
MELLVRQDNLGKDNQTVWNCQEVAFHQIDKCTKFIETAQRNSQTLQEDEERLLQVDAEHDVLSTACPSEVKLSLRKRPNRQSDAARMFHNYKKKVAQLMEELIEEEVVAHIRASDTMTHHKQLHGQHFDEARFIESLLRQ